MSHDHEQWDDQPKTIPLTDEEGNTREFYILDMVELGPARYWLMEPAPPVDEEEEGVWILRETQNEEGQDVLVFVEDEEEADRVWQFWQSQAGLD